MKILFLFKNNFILLYQKIYIYFKYIYFLSLIFILIYRNYSLIIKDILSLNINNSLKILEEKNFHIPLHLYIQYVKDCKNLKRYNYKKKNFNEYPFISICISAYNVEKYIEKSILSVLNQSFGDFEIIIVNDFSQDNTNNIIQRLQMEDSRIKILNHNQNFGTYKSRCDSVFNSKGKYIFFLDSDDVILNPMLFQLLYYYNINYNMDIFEFTVYHSIEKLKKIFYPEEHYLNHNHGYKKKFIYQPELSNLLYYDPETKNYSSVFCRTLWNKIYRKDILLKSIKYIGIEYYKYLYIIVVEDTLLNIINFQFAFNYTNIKIPGYLYNIRKFSVSHNKDNKKHLILESKSFYFYFKLFLKYIKDFDKDRNFIYYELKQIYYSLRNFKKYNIKEYVLKTKQMFLDILNDNKSTLKIKQYINELIMEL